MNWDWYQLIQWMRMDSDLNLMSFRRMMSWHRSFFQIMRSHISEGSEYWYSVQCSKCGYSYHTSQESLELLFQPSFQSFVLNTYYTHSFTLTNRNEINDLLLITHSSNTFCSFQQILHITQYHPYWMKVSKWQDNLQYHNPS